MAPRVMTVGGPIPPEQVGFTLPHEHTAITLWEVPGRWDYWALASGEELVAEELRELSAARRLHARRPDAARDRP